jgi:hypothetical protein
VVAPDLPPVPPMRSAASEPLATVGVVTALAVAVIVLLVSFGVHIRDDQRLAIVGVIAAAAPIVTALWGRLKVWSPKTVARLAADLRRSPPPAGPLRSTLPPTTDLP